MRVAMSNTRWSSVHVGVLGSCLRDPARSEAARGGREALSYVMPRMSANSWPSVQYTGAAAGIYQKWGLHAQHRTLQI